MREPTNGKGAHIECLMNGKGGREELILDV